MRLRKKFVLPEDKREAEQRARRLEYWTIFFLVTITALMYSMMGGSQAMKTAWIEDVLSLVPPIVFLLASHQRDKGPDGDYPYGRQRIMGLSFTGAAFALVILGVYMVWDSSMGLIRQEHPTLGHRTILGVRTWEGWFMIGALAYSAIPPMILGRMKLPLAEELHEKTLKTDADMNKADWMTATAGIAGILGVGYGLWWADSAAALFISVGVLKDGVENVKGVFSDLMDQPPADVERKRETEVIEGCVSALTALEWVRDADVRLRDEGAVIAGEAFVVPRTDAVTLEQLEEATRAVHAVDWKIYDVVVTAVKQVDVRRAPQEAEPVR